MKRILLGSLFSLLAGTMSAQCTDEIKLNPPDLEGGLPVMKALSLRASAVVFDTTDLKLQDLSNLLWAGNGVNRPDEGKRTAPSAMNAQDIEIYVIQKSGVYLYNAKRHVLELVLDGDHRDLIPERDDAPHPPVLLLLVSDISRFRFGEDAKRLEWAGMDAGIVSQNISVFCASAGLATRPRASMDKQKIRETLKLRDSEHPVLNHPVAYKKE